MIVAAFGMKCPLSHEAVQVSSSIGHPSCSVCGRAMVPNDAAEPVGAHKTCRNCGQHFGMISNDSGNCPTCSKPW